MSKFLDSIFSNNNPFTHEGNEYICEENYEINQKELKNQLQRIRERHETDGMMNEDEYAEFMRQVKMIEDVENRIMAIEDEFAKDWRNDVRQREETNTMMKEDEFAKDWRDNEKYTKQVEKNNEMKEFCLS